MDDSLKASMQQVLHRWIKERHDSLLEQVLLTWEEGMGRLRPDDSLLLEIATLAAPPPPPETPADLGLGAAPLAADTEADLGRGLDSLEQAASQGEVLKRLLEATHAFAERTAVFVVKQGIATLYAARGFEADAPKPGSPVLPPPELEDLIQGRSSSVSQPGPSYSALLAPLSRFEASSVRIFPLKLRRKVVALVLADSGLRQSLDSPQHVRALVHVAEAALGALAVQKEEEKTAAPVPTAAPHAMMTQRIQDPITVSEKAPLDPKVRANAERSARVLVGDIELYFPQKVKQGLSNRNMYGALRDELERSRASFVDRYGLELEKDHAIFQSTLIQLLCQGDAELLGPAPWNRTT